MQLRKKIYWLFLLAIIIALIGAFVVIPLQCARHADKKEVATTENCSNRIQVFLHCHASDYFLYKGRPIGFQYELLLAMCDSLGLEPILSLSNATNEVKQDISSKNYDIVAVDIDAEAADSSQVLLSVAHSTSFPVLICREGDKTNFPKILYVPAHFPGQFLLSSLGTPNDWEVVYSSQMEEEELFGLLQDNKIHYLVSDYNTVLALLPFYPDLKIAAKIGPEYARRWVLNPANVTLNQRINQWIETYKKSEDYQNICAKYLKPHTKYLKAGAVEKRSGRISAYDPLIKKYARDRHLDWRFVASIIYQESRFTTDAVGVGGSFGIMQMMPTTANHLGIDTTATTEEQLCAGIRLIASMTRHFTDIEDEDERLFFVAAAYNAGPGHILDARSLCRKHGGNPNLWLDVAPYLALKSDKNYYTDPVVRNGYFPGSHTIRYTREVMNRYHAYVISLPH